MRAPGERISEEKIPGEGISEARISGEGISKERISGERISKERIPGERISKKSGIRTRDFQLLRLMLYPLGHSAHRKPSRRRASSFFLLDGRTAKSAARNSFYNGK